MSSVDEGDNISMPNIAITPITQFTPDPRKAYNQALGATTTDYTTALDGS